MQILLNVPAISYKRIGLTFHMLKMLFSHVLGVIALLATGGVMAEKDLNCDGSGMCAVFACGGSSCMEQLRDMIRGVNASQLFPMGQQIACVKPRPGPGICAFFQTYEWYPVPGGHGDAALDRVQELVDYPCAKCGSSSISSAEGPDDERNPLWFTVNYVTKPCGHGLC